METTIVLSERELADLIEAALEHRAAEIAQGLGSEVKPKDLSWGLRRVWDWWWMPDWVWHLGFPRKDRFEVHCVFHPVRAKAVGCVSPPKEERAEYAHSNGGTVPRRPHGSVGV